MSTHWVEAFDPQRLVALRKDRHLTQQDLAELLYTSSAKQRTTQRAHGPASEEPDFLAAARRIRTLVTRIAFYETGRHHPRGSALRDLAAALHVDVLDLLKEGTRLTLATLRARLGLTQEAVAVKLGISRAGYGHVEQGRRPLDITEAQQLQQILKVSDEQLRAALDASLQAADGQADDTTA